MPFIHLDPPSKVTFKRLLSYVFRFKALFPIIIISLVFLSASQGLLALIIEDVVDKVMIERVPFWLKWIPLFLFIIFLIRGVSSAGTTYYMGKLARKVIFTLRKELFHKYTLLDNAYLSNTNDAELTAKMTFHIEQVAQASSKALRSLIEDSATIIVLLGIMFIKSWQLSLFVFAVIPVLMLVIRLVSKLFNRYSKRILGSVSDITQITEEAIIGHKVVKVFNGQEIENSKFANSNEQNFNGNMKVLLTKAASNILIQLVAGTAVALVVYFAAWHTNLTTGEFTSFLTALILINTPIKKLLNINEVIQMGVASAGSIFEVFDSNAEVDNGTIVNIPSNPTLSFNDVSFTYPGKEEQVISNLDFSLPAGRMLAFVGSSGSGKSTIASLLPRFYDVQSGSIHLADKDIREYKLETLRSLISYVGQDIFLFNDTIANNIAYAYDGDYTREEVIKAAEAAHVMEFIEGMPEGLDTMVGDRGILLSGGQRQRIAIARAIMKDAPILVLDEATSALDTESERLVQNQLEGLMQGRTTLVIAHRLSTIEMADEIIVMEQGKVIERGNHQSLLSQNGQYAKLQQMQSAAH